MGDLIVSLNGEKIKDRDELNRVTKRYKPGDEAILIVSRNHEEVTVKGEFISDEDRLPENTGTVSLEINGRIFEFNYDDGSLDLKD